MIYEDQLDIDIAFSAMTTPLTMSQRVMRAIANS